MEKHFPGIVLGVNTYRYDENIKNNREFDIIAKKSIIEIKGEVGKKCGKQFVSQKEYCDSNGKNYYIFAPNMNKIRKLTYSKLGVTICSTIDELISKIKEDQK